MAYFASNVPQKQNLCKINSLPRLFSDKTGEISEHLEDLFIVADLSGFKMKETSAFVF